MSQTWSGFSSLVPFILLFIFNQSIMALQSCVSVCGTAKSIGYTPPLPLEPPPACRPPLWSLLLLAPGPTPRPLQSAEPSPLRGAAAPTRRPLHTRPRVRQSYSLSSPPRPFLRCVHTSVLQVRASIPALQTGSSVPFPQIPYTCVHTRFCLPWLLFEGVARPVTSASPSPL